MGISAMDKTCNRHGEARMGTSLTPENLSQSTLGGTATLGSDESHALLWGHWGGWVRMDRHRWANRVVWGSMLPTLYIETRIDQLSGC